MIEMHEPTNLAGNSRSTTDGDPKLPIPISTADPPFNKETTDLVLQTSDGFQFHVWKCILAQASPVFEDMFALGEPLSHTSQESENTKNEKGLAQISPSRPSVPVIEDLEDYATLRLLLRWNYPPSHIKLIGKPGLELSELKPILAAARTYQMDGAVLEITDILINDCHKFGPLRVYAIGARYGFHDVMHVAARCFLSLPTSGANAYVEGLEDISGGAYHRLCEYRRKCIATLAEMVEDLTWLADGVWIFKKTSGSCTCVADLTGTKYRFNADDKEYILIAWFTGRYQRITSVLLDKPCPKAIADEELREAVKQGSKCLYCRERVHNHMRLFTAHLKQQVDRRN